MIGGLTIKPTQEMLQNTMENVFPDWRAFPGNSMTAAISEHLHKKNISFLILGQRDMVKHFYTEQADKTDITTKVYVKDNRNNAERRDLVIRFTFSFPEEEIAWESVIYGELGDKQIEFIQELGRQEKVFLFIADESGEMIKIKRLSWGLDAETMMEMTDNSRKH
jgi:hypothetical protein